MAVHPLVLASTSPRLRRPGLPRIRFRAAVPRLSVVLVNYHHWNDTAALLRQLRSAECLHRGQAEVVIIDNNSPKHPIIPRLRRLRGVSLWRWRRNRGFARAVNEGCRLGQGEWLLLLNPDMTLQPGFLDQVAVHAEALLAQDPRTGIVGFRLHHDDGSRQLSTGPFPTLAGTLLRMFLPRSRRKYDNPPPALDEPTPVDWVTGCCLLVRRDCWDDLGGFDPGFFLYYEDVDLCKRARQRGWSVWFDPGPCATHHRPLHVRSVPPHLRVITRHALLTYARKHWPGWHFRLLSRIVGLEARVRGGLAWLTGDAQTGLFFGELARIAGQMESGRHTAAGRRLVRLVWQLEEQRGPADSLDRHPGSASP
jgi:GT2 family glycosyltransferase